MSRHSYHQVRGERPATGLETEHARLSERALVAEQQLTRMAHLYASVSQLHQAPTVGEVQLVLKEIVANLLGCEEMGIFAITRPGPIYTYLDGIGLDPDRLGVLLPTAGPLPGLLEGPAVLVPESPDRDALHGHPVHAIIRLDDRGIPQAVVILFRLLRQKRCIEPWDRDLLEAIALHGGRAWANAELRGGDA